MILRLSRHRTVILFAISLSALLMLVGAPVNAQDGGPIRSALVINDPGTVTIRDQLVITAVLSDELGQAVGAVDNEALELLIDGVKVRRVRTEEDGTATFTLKNQFAAGTYTAKVLYHGSKSLLASSATAEIVIDPAEVEIVTIPPIEDLRFTLGDQETTTGVSGVAEILVDRLGTYTLQVHPEDSADRRLKFNRWQDEVFQPMREIDVKRVTSLEVGFDVSYPVSITYFDLDRLVVDPDRISSVVLRSSHGTEATLNAPDLATSETGPVWLQSGRVVRRFHGLEETPILWSVESVQIDGTNVVNRAQQRFFVDKNDLWEIELLLYAARFTARDALFGFPLGEGVNLRFPNGDAHVVQFEPSNEVLIQSLPRGEYTVNVAGAPGYSPVAPVALSRDQEVHLLVISYLDIGVAIALLSLLSVGLIFIGRPNWLTYLRIPGGSARHRRAFLVLAALALVTGVAILNVGLGNDRASSHGEPVETAKARGDAPAVLGPVFTTGDADESPEAGASKNDTVYINDELLAYDQQHIPVASVFRSFWEEYGALAVFGQPVSRPHKQQDRVTQHFERFTLEYHPEYAGTADEIQIRHLGSEDAARRGLDSTPPFETAQTNSGPGETCRYFPVTGHWVCDQFLAYWSSQGLTLGDQDVTYRESIGLFGYPISEPFEDPESGRTIQYFEQVRLELYPEYSDSPHEVQQGDLKGAQK